MSKQGKGVEFVARVLVDGKEVGAENVLPESKEGFVVNKPTSEKIWKGAMHYARRLKEYLVATDVASPADSLEVIKVMAKESKIEIPKPDTQSEGKIIPFLPAPVPPRNNSTAIPPNTPTTASKTVTAPAATKKARVPNPVIPSPFADAEFADYVLEVQQ